MQLRDYTVGGVHCIARGAIRYAKITFAQTNPLRLFVRDLKSTVQTTKQINHQSRSHTNLHSKLPDIRQSKRERAYLHLIIHLISFSVQNEQKPKGKQKLLISKIK